MSISGMGETIGNSIALGASAGVNGVTGLTNSMEGSGLYTAVSNGVKQGATNSISSGLRSASTNTSSTEVLDSNGIMRGETVDPSLFKYLEETKSKEEKKILEKLGTQYYAQPAYGVQPPVAVPAYGVVLPDLNISVEEMKENISTLDSAIKTLKNSWDKETASLAKQLSNSWAGKDCAQYIDKLTKMDKKVDNTIKALELLRNTYQKALDLVLEKQKSTANAIATTE